MIQSLDDAWKWYTAVRTIAYDIRHLAGIWDEPALETVLSLDGRLRHRTAADLLYLQRLAELEAAGEMSEAK
ncbi:MAG: hypothetical protein WBX00_00185 [Isosphaeraceae bacterium]